MTSHTSTKTHFGMDERGLGGTHMIQQQFLTMHRKVRDAQKMVDNNPPTASMFRRPYFSQFGEYWERIKPPTLQCKAKVDSSAPASYKLIANLYINKKAKKTKKAKPSPRPKADTLPEVSNTRVIDVPRCNSLDEYQEFCNKRREEIAEEMSRMKQSRALRQTIETEEEDADEDVAHAARAALSFLDAKESPIQLPPPTERPATAPSPPPRDRPTDVRSARPPPKATFDSSPMMATPRRMDAVSTLTPAKMRTVPHPPASAPQGISPQQRKKVTGQLAAFEDEEDEWDDHY